MAQLRQMAQEMADVQRQMAEAPAAVVIANHAMGIYELATIHLRQQPPNLAEAKVAIDAFGALLEALKGRLGPDEADPHPGARPAPHGLRPAHRRRPAGEAGPEGQPVVTVLVTGGAGYIGSHTVRLLRERGRDVVVLDSMEFGHRDAVLGAPLVVGDIDDAELVQRTVAEHGVESVDPLRRLQGGRRVDGAAGPLLRQQRRRHQRAARRAARRPGSTRSCSPRPARCTARPRSCRSTRTTRSAPRAPTARASAWSSRCSPGTTPATTSARSACATSTPPARRPTAASARTGPYTLNLVPLVMKAALGRIPPRLGVRHRLPDTPDGTAIRDYVHVEDLADAHLRALEYLEAGEKTTADQPRHRHGLLGPRGDRRGPRRRAASTSRCRTPTAGAGDPVAIYGDNRRPPTCSGWRPDRNLTTIVSSAWQWHSTHPDGYAD